MAAEAEAKRLAKEKAAAEKAALEEALAAADTSSPEYIAARKEFVAKAAEEHLIKKQDEYFTRVNLETKNFDKQREE